MTDGPAATSTVSVVRLEHHIAISDQFQSFSAEIARLALLVIGALLLFGEHLLLPAQPNSTVTAAKDVLDGLGAVSALTVACLVLCVATCLLHRYLATDSVVHIAELQGSILSPLEESNVRGLLRSDLKRSGYLLVAACCSLALGSFGAAQIAFNVVFQDSGRLMTGATLGLAFVTWVGWKVVDSSSRKSR
jgi:hypothetical protein